MSEEIEKRKLSETRFLVVLSAGTFPTFEGPSFVESRAAKLKELWGRRGTLEKRRALETRGRERRQKGPRKPSVFLDLLGIIWVTVFQKFGALRNTLSLTCPLTVLRALSLSLMDKKNWNQSWKDSVRRRRKRSPLCLG